MRCFCVFEICRMRRCYGEAHEWKQELNLESWSTWAVCKQHKWGGHLARGVSWARRILDFESNLIRHTVHDLGGGFGDEHIVGRHAKWENNLYDWCYEQYNRDWREKCREGYRCDGDEDAIRAQWEVSQCSFVHYVAR